MTVIADQSERDRFTQEWTRNFAVSANAGSGKTTAISHRLAAMALDEQGREALRTTAVVTYTNKAAGEIELRAREVLWRKLEESPNPDWRAVEAIDEVFFGTIHSFCLQLAQSHGPSLGLNLNPALVDAEEAALWELFLDDEPLAFERLSEPLVKRFLRHANLNAVFELARNLSAAQANRLLQTDLGMKPPEPYAPGLTALLALEVKGKGKAAENLMRSQLKAQAWQKDWESGATFLPLYTPEGKAAKVVEAGEKWMAPLRGWLGRAGGILAAELARKYQMWRETEGLQTYGDQIDAAMAVLADKNRLNEIRSEGWRVILDEAQDTDPEQFSVLVEITRAPGEPAGNWPPEAGEFAAAPPRAGHFCLVGDGQQAIYGSRADLRNFQRHLTAFRDGDGGEVLEFQVTFRAPQAVVQGLNASLPGAFGEEQDYNFGVPDAEDGRARLLQVPYVPLVPGPSNVVGDMSRFPLAEPASDCRSIEDWMREEARQVGTWLRETGLEGIGAQSWSEVTLLAPRNEWLEHSRQELERLGWEVSLQSRRSRAGDQPAFAWLSGLLAICCDPEDTFEWVGVLREIGGFSDALIAQELRRVGRIAWESPEDHDASLARWLEKLRPFLLRVDDEGWPLSRFIGEIVDEMSLRERARLLDETGGAELELDRLLAEAAEIGVEGGGPREWERALREQADQGVASGRSSENAINLLTCHSAKGLEWPVVIPLGLWRKIGSAPLRGLQLVEGSEPQVYLDQRGIPANTTEARRRERWREYTRLLYVTLTRARRRLIVPWGDEFGSKRGSDPSFAELWAYDLNEITEFSPAAAPATDSEPFRIGDDDGMRTSHAAGELPSILAGNPFPQRILPHSLGSDSDRVREFRHESGGEEILSPGGEEAVAYGTWWHEMVEFLPWDGGETAISAYWEAARPEADAAGFGERALADWARFRQSSCWQDIASEGWQRRAEMALLAPLGELGWVDGVVDLVLWDANRASLWVVDWKTNRKRRDESEEAFHQRLSETYKAQLQAYGRCLETVFPGVAQRLLVYATETAAWVEISEGEIYPD
ncbi:MAG: hypothetical protein SynsKO_22330 [Synoicihabitans sp.]